MPEYGCTFTALPATTPATPHRRTPRPRIDGQQIALIAGPEGEEIHTDRFGRVKLWFPWDRRAQKDGSDTCWVRVAQSWAGSGWGAQTIPRVGMEALVTYLDGDPDRPVVTGLVPNPRQKVPYSLPENKTRTVFRTDTYKGKGSNELSFEDRAGREEVYLHAERNLSELVLRDKTTVVNNDETKRVGATYSLHTVGDTILNAKRDRTDLTGDTHSLSAGNDINIEAADVLSLDSGKSLSLATQTNLTATAAEGIVIQANRSIILLVGRSRVEIGPDGIRIVSPRIDLN